MHNIVMQCIKYTNFYSWIADTKQAEIMLVNMTCILITQGRFSVKIKCGWPDIFHGISQISQLKAQKLRAASTSVSL